MALKKKRSRARRRLSLRRRRFNRKLDARQEAHRRIGNARKRIRERVQKRAEAREAGREQRADELTAFIKDDQREIDNLRKQIQQLNSAIQSVKNGIARVEGLIRRLTRRIRRRKRRRRRKPDLGPGDPGWGGSKAIFDNEVTPAAGVPPHSTKRSETYGNPGSDHHVSQLLAYAGDYPPSVQRAIAIGRKLGISYRGYADDYKFYYIKRFGRTYRVQIIASNHGTGPHVHTGAERI